MSILTHKIYEISSKNIIICDEYDSEPKYYLESKYYLDYESLKSLSYLTNKLDNGVYIYGEVDAYDNNEFLVDLRNVSHIIENININIIMERKNKLRKIKGEELINTFNVIIKIRILDTHQGKQIKLMMDNGAKIVSNLKCTKSDSYIKIFTENISY